MGIIDSFPVLVTGLRGLYRLQIVDKLLPNWGNLSQQGHQLV